MHALLRSEHGRDRQGRRAGFQGIKGIADHQIRPPTAGGAPQGAEVPAFPFHGGGRHRQPCGPILGLGEHLRVQEVRDARGGCEVLDALFNVPAVLLRPGLLVESFQVALEHGGNRHRPGRSSFGQLASGLGLAPFIGWGLAPAQVVERGAGQVARGVHRHRWPTAQLPKGGLHPPLAGPLGDVPAGGLGPGAPAQQESRLAGVVDP